MQKYLLIVYGGPTATKQDIIQLMPCLTDGRETFGLQKDSKSFGIHLDEQYADCFVVRPKSYVSRGKFLSTQIEEALQRYNTAVGPNDSYKTKVVICHESQKSKVVPLLDGDYEECTLPTYQTNSGDCKWDPLDVKLSLAEIVEGAKMEVLSDKFDRLLEYDKRYKIPSFAAIRASSKLGEIPVRLDELVRLAG